MKKWKSSLTLALTTVLILLCACLPRLAAYLTDGKQESGYAPISAVELILRGGDSMLSKIAVQCRADQAIEIPEELTSHTIEEMMAFAAEELKRYQDAGVLLFPDLDVPGQTLSYNPWMAVAEGTRSNVLWSLRILLDEEMPVLWLTLDDETGKLLCVNCEYSKEAWFDPETSLQTLVELYFSGLGEEAPEIDAPNLSNKYRDGEIVGQHWRWFWVDDDLGDCGISFYLYQYGFDISLVQNWEDEN